MVCPALVIQRGDVFTPGSQAHQHSGNQGAVLGTEIYTQIKERAKDELFESAPSIVVDVLVQNGDSTAPPRSRPKVANLVRMANRTRQKLRPDEPKDLNFEVDEDFLPEDFYLGTVIVNEYKHLLFAFELQLHILASARTWYMDGTFKMVQHPFVQLFSIHAFLGVGTTMKQVPLLFCLMSSKRKEDYDKMFKFIKNRILQSPPKVEGFVVDFEAAVWLALRNRFPTAPIQGCVFHFTQAIWRKVQELGLQVSYNARDDVFKFVRKLMALPLLPPEHIPDPFTQLQEKVRHCPKLKELTKYINNTWMNSAVWRIESWSAFTLM